MSPDRTCMSDGDCEWWEPVVAEESGVRQEDVAEIMNRVNDALEGTEYEAVAYDNTGPWLNVVIDRK